jgi:hypothetical protein
LEAAEHEQRHAEHEFSELQRLPRESDRLRLAGLFHNPQHAPFDAVAAFGPQLEHERWAEELQHHEHHQMGHLQPPAPPRFHQGHPGLMQHAGPGDWAREFEAHAQRHHPWAGEFDRFPHAEEDRWAADFRHHEEQERLERAYEEATDGTHLLVPLPRFLILFALLVWQVVRAGRMSMRSSKRRSGPRTRRSGNGTNGSSTTSRSGKR